MNSNTITYVKFNKGNIDYGSYLNDESIHLIINNLNGKYKEALDNHNSSKIWTEVFLQYMINNNGYIPTGYSNDDTKNINIFYQIVYQYIKQDQEKLWWKSEGKDGYIFGNKQIVKAHQGSISNSHYFRQFKKN